MTTVKSNHWPTELRLKKDRRILEIDFDNGQTFTLLAELLRVESPSAELQGHGVGKKKIIEGCRHIRIISVHPVGRYAISITFDDMHNTGIYSWDYLYTLGANQTRIWQDYIASLARLGLSRDI